MPQKIKTMVDGKEVEQDVYSADEVAEQAEAKAKEIAEAKIAEESERLKTEHEAELAEKDEAFAKDKKELEDLRKKDFNFKKLRDQKTLTPEQEEEAKKVTDDLKKLNETVAEIQRQPFDTAKSSFVKKNIGADKDLAEKHEFFFKKLSVGAKTMEEYNTALESAFTLATGKPYQANSDGAMVRTSVNPDFGGEGGKVESQDSQNFGSLLGITPEDKKKYAPAVKSGTVPLFYQTPQKENK